MALEEQLVDKLLEKNYKISFAESCTGGLCCGTLVNVTNASKVLDMSFVTYSNESKMKLIVKRLPMKWQRVLLQRQAVKSVLV